MAILIILSYLFIPSVFAQDTIPIAVYLISIDNYDIATGTYNADFWVEFQCKNCSINDFELINGRIIDMNKIFLPETNSTYYRVNAAFTDTVELHSFPLDSQTVTIVIEHSKLTSDKIVLVPDLSKSGIDSFVYIPGWRIDGWQAFSRDHFYGLYGQSHSTYTFEVSLTRHRDAAVLILLPIFFVVCIILFTLLLSVQRLDLRVGIVSSALLAAIMYHLAVGSHLPPAIGYLLLVDKVMLLTYFILLAIFILNVYLLYLVHNKKMKAAQKWYYRTRYSWIIIAAASYLLLFILFFWNFV